MAWADYVDGLVAEDNDRGVEGREWLGGGGHDVAGSNPRLLYAYDTLALARVKWRLVDINCLIQL